MQTNYMREFIALAENLNFTSTASHLFITQPALSRHIALMEKELGVQLFIRTKHEVELTKAGRILYKEFLKIILEYDRIISSLNGMSNNNIVGKLKIGMLYYAIEEYVTPSIREFRERYPNIYLSYASLQAYQVIKALVNNEVDIGLIMRSKFFSSDQFIFHPIAKEKLRLLVLKSDPLAERKSIAVEELSRQKMIFLEQEQEYTDIISGLLKRHNAFPNKYEITEHVDTINFALEETNGVFIGPAALKNMVRKNITMIDIDSEDFYLEMCFAYRKKNNNPAITLFLNSLQNKNGNTRYELN